MINYIYILVFFLCGQAAFAGNLSQQEALEETRKLTQGLKQPDTNNKDMLEFMNKPQGTAEERRQWDKQMKTQTSDLSREAEKLKQRDPTFQTITNSEASRARFEKAQNSYSAAQTEEIMGKANKILSAQKGDCIEVPDPEAMEKSREITRHICEISREPEEFKCSQYLELPTVKVIPAEYRHHWCSQGNHGPDDPRCNAKTYYDPPLLYKEKQVIVSPDKWVSQCETLQARPECKVVAEECLESNKSQVINKEAIHKPCWRKQLTYACQYPSANNCSQYQRKDCQQMSSKCAHWVGKKCYVWQQNYECYQTKQQIKKKIVCGAPAFCMDGNCAHASIEPNKEFEKTISQLAILNEHQKNVRENNNGRLPRSENDIEIFRGTQHHCEKTVAGTKNCCNLNGWLKGIGVLQCSAEEEILTKKRFKNLCHEVGGYVSAKVPLTGIPLARRRTFCCYNSKLTRNIQEQGRAQLRLGWGHPEHPICGGFTTKQLKDIEFDKLDLSEAFDELKPASNLRGNKKIKDTEQVLKQRLESMKRQNSPKGPVAGGENGHL